MFKNRVKQLEAENESLKNKLKVVRDLSETYRVEINEKNAKIKKLEAKIAHSASNYDEDY